MGFTKLFNDIVCSSIWNEDDKTRIVWVTLLALKNGNHVAHTSIGGLAVQARVTVEDCKKAVDKLLAPDDDDRSGILEGRRIQKVPGGFYIVNGEAYRERRDADDRRAYMAELMRNKRRKEKEAKEAAALADVSNGKHPLAPVSIVSLSEADAEEDKKENTCAREKKLTREQLESVAYPVTAKFKNQATTDSIVRWYNYLYAEHPDHLIGIGQLQAMALRLCQYSSGQEIENDVNEAMSKNRWTVDYKDGKRKY